MAKEDYRKSSLETVTKEYEIVMNWADRISNLIDKSEMLVDPIDKIGPRVEVRSYIQYLYNFAKLGAMANVTGLSKELSEHEEAMHEEES